MCFPPITEENGKKCDPACSDHGCWGPGPDKCLTCKSYSNKQSQVCLSSCKDLPMLYEAENMTCDVCHPQCAKGCTGPVSRSDEIIYITIVRTHWKLKSMNSSTNRKVVFQKTTRIYALKKKTFSACFLSVWNVIHLDLPVCKIRPIKWSWRSANTWMTFWLVCFSVTDCLWLWRM